MLETIELIVKEAKQEMEDKNLSWLINYKLDELPHLSPEAKRKVLGDNKNVGGEVQGYEKTHFEDDTNVAENVTIEHISRTPKKPPFTYTELIEYALEEQGELTVSGIYQWISDRFKYYKSNDDRWKNSVRHNLSINPHFRKGSKATQGAGHLWTISSRDSEVNLLAWEHKKQRLELFFKMEESANRTKQNDAVTQTNILNQHQHDNHQHLQQQQQQQQQEQQQQQHQYIHHNIMNQDHTNLHNQHMEEYEAVRYITTSAIPVSTAAVTTLHSSDCTDLHSVNNGIYTTYRNSLCPNQSIKPQYLHHHHGQTLQPVDDVHSELQKSAGEILHGVNRGNVEVQVMQTTDNSIQSYAILDSDYLNPISKDEIVQECGLRTGKRFEPGHEYYVTTIDPVELGINLPASVENDGILFEDDFNFQYFGSNIIA